MSVLKINVEPIDPNDPVQKKAVKMIQRAALADIEAAQKAVGYIQTSFNVALGACIALLSVGVLAGVVTVIGANAALEGNNQNTTNITVVLGALATASFLGVYALRPLDSLERNAILAPLVAAIMSVFWLRIADAKDNNKEVKKIVNDLVLQLGGVLDKHTAATSKYIEALKTKEEPSSSEDDAKKGGDGESESGGDTGNGEADDNSNKKS